MTMAPATSTPPAKAVSPEKALRRLFLMLFLRGRSSRGLQRKGAPKSVARRLITVLIFYSLFGCVALQFVKQPIFSLAIYLHGVTFVFLGMFISSSAGEVLFNKEESDILLHRPITPQALLWAKISVLIEISLWIAASHEPRGNDRRNCYRRLGFSVRPCDFHGARGTLLHGLRGDGLSAVHPIIRPGKT